MKKCKSSNDDWENSQLENDWDLPIDINETNLDNDRYGAEIDTNDFENETQENRFQGFIEIMSSVFWLGFLGLSVIIIPWFHPSNAQSMQSNDYKLQPAVIMTNNQSKTIEEINTIEESAVLSLESEAQAKERKIKAQKLSRKEWFNSKNAVYRYLNEKFNCFEKEFIKTQKNENMENHAIFQTVGEAKTLLDKLEVDSKAMISNLNEKHCELQSQFDQHRSAEIGAKLSESVENITRITSIYNQQIDIIKKKLVELESPFSQISQNFGPGFFFNLLQNEDQTDENDVKQKLAQFYHNSFYQQTQLFCLQKVKFEKVKHVLKLNWKNFDNWKKFENSNPSSEAYHLKRLSNLGLEIKKETMTLFQIQNLQLSELKKELHFDVNRSAFDFVFGVSEHVSNLPNSNLVQSQKATNFDGFSSNNVIPQTQSVMTEKDIDNMVLRQKSIINSRLVVYKKKTKEANIEHQNQLIDLQLKQHEEKWNLLEFHEKNIELSHSSRNEDLQLLYVEENQSLIKRHQEEYQNLIKSQSEETEKILSELLKNGTN